MTTRVAYAKALAEAQQAAEEVLYLPNRALDGVSSREVADLAEIGRAHV